MRVLRNRSLLIIGLAESVSGIGNWITMLAVFAMVVFRGGGGVVESGGIFLAGLVPTMVASPLAGWLCDRYDRKWLMFGSEVLDGLTVCGLIFTGRLELIYVLLAIQAVVMSVMTPARQAAIPDIVADDDLTQANAFLQQLASLIKIGAPMLAGAVIALLGPHQAIVLDVVSFALSALILSQLPSLKPPARLAQATAGQTVRGEPAPGGPAVASSAALAPAGNGGAGASALQTVLRSTQLRLLFVTIFLAVVVVVGFDVLASIFTRDVLQGNEGFFGLLVGLVGLGSALAAAWLLLGGVQHEAWHHVTVGLALLACLPGALALAGIVGTVQAARLAAIAGCLVGGLGHGLAVVQMGTLLQRCSPPALLGRISGLFQSTTVAGQLAGILLTPLLVPLVLPIDRYFALATAALLMVALYLALSLRRALQPAQA